MNSKSGNTQNSDILIIENLSVSYGGIRAVKNISLRVPRGQIITLIGANGAGKSTTLRTVAGVVRPSSAASKITFDGENITGRDPTYIVSRGITLVPEGRRVFPNLTVAENLKIGAYIRRSSPDEDLERIYSLFPRLRERRWQTAGTLSGGEQQMLAVGRALMSRPRLIMMDEPSLGLAPLIVRDIFGIIKTIHDEGITVLLIEQNANLALKIADRAYVMETGVITMDGTGAELLENEEIKEAYLGKKSDKA
jgi:branched-chain amino acid transport system ATP-binding protein